MKPGTYKLTKGGWKPIKNKEFDTRPVCTCLVGKRSIDWVARSSIHLSIRDLLASAIRHDEISFPRTIQCSPHYIEMEDVKVKWFQQNGTCLFCSSPMSVRKSCVVHEQDINSFPCLYKVNARFPFYKDNTILCCLFCRDVSKDISMEKALRWHAKEFLLGKISMCFRCKNFRKRSFIDGLCKRCCDVSPMASMYIPIDENGISDNQQAPIAERHPRADDAISRRSRGGLELLGPIFSPVHDSFATSFLK